MTISVHGRLGAARADDDADGSPPAPGREGRSKVGLALASGGPVGAIYEIGALRAVDEALDGFDLHRADVYVGVSAGAFLGASLANRLDTAQLCRAIVSHEPGEHPFIPKTFLTPAASEWLQGSLKIPRLLGESLMAYVRDPFDSSMVGALTRAARALPVGLFDNRPIRSYLETIYTRPGRTNDFRRLDSKLVVVAVDLDSAEPVRFGEPPYDHVPISSAVQASTALPGLYPPVDIEGRSYVDGVLIKTLHASVALDAGVDLLLAINPIVPVDTVRAVEEGVMKRGKLVDRGLPTVLSQTFRTLIHSRMAVGMAAYDQRYTDRDVIRIEPPRDDYMMFFSNIFSFANRVSVCEHAYHQTRRELLAHHDELAPVLAAHGITLRRDVLEEEDRDLWLHAGLEPRPDAAGVDLTHEGRDRRARREAKKRRHEKAKKRAVEQRRGRRGRRVTERLGSVLDRIEEMMDEVPEASDASEAPDTPGDDDRQTAAA